MANKYDSYPFDKHEFRWCVKFDQVVDMVMQPWLLDAGFMPKPLTSLTERTREPFVPSDLSPHLGEGVISALKDKGFTVTSIDASVITASSFPSACVNVKVVRRYQVVVFRLFVPMLLLVSTPMVGFFLPVRATMPRIATGFISFLSLQVFVGRGYAMIPRATSTLVFIDALMLSMTEMLYLAVLENIVAVRLDASVSHHAAEFLDKTSRIGFPFMMISVVSALAAMGVGGTDKGVIMLVLHLIIFVFSFSVFVRLKLYMRRLPENIIRILIDDINSGKLLWADHTAIDVRELSIVFKFIDNDGSGFINGDELIDVFKRFGLDLPEDKLHELKALMQQEFGEHVDFLTFQTHFKKVFGGNISHHVQKEKQLKKSATSGSLNNTAV